MTGNDVVVVAPQTMEEIEQVKLTGDFEDNKLSIKKLCSTLTNYFTQSSTPWESPCEHLIISFRNGDAVAGNALSQVQESLSLLISQLSQHQIVVLMWFSGILADEMYRVQANASPAHAHLHKLMESTVVDVSSIMSVALRQPAAGNTFVKNEALKSWFTWVNYAQPMWPSNQHALQQLRDLIEPAAQCIALPDVQYAALEIFRDMLESYPTFFQPNHINLIGHLISVHVQPALLQHLRNPEVDPAGMLYGQVVTAFGNANIPHIVEHPEEAMEIVRLFFEVLRSPGSVGDADEISRDTIEFWNGYVEHVIESTGSNGPDDDDPHDDDLLDDDSDDDDPVDETPWLPHTRNVLTTLVELLLHKMKTPDLTTVSEWDDDSRQLFKDFRSDAGDLLLSIYLILSRPMLERITTLTLQSLSTKEWRGLEAAVLCLNLLADNVLEDQSSEDVLGAIFSSNLLREVADFDQQMPNQVRRTAIDMLRAYGQFIERHSEYLPDAVRFLFKSLQTPLCTTAAKSIASLCSTCRAALTGELAGFLQQYQTFAAGPTSDPYTKQKCMRAIACIVQAVKPESAKVQPLLGLLENVERDCQTAREYIAQGNTEMAEITGASALSCLSSVGKGLQVPDDTPISLYENEQPHASGQISFWDQLEGQAVQQRIIGCFEVLQIVGTSGEAVEAACQVLRSGYAEMEPGPFVMPPAVTVNFLQQCALTTPQLEYVLSTTCLLISRHSRTGVPRIDNDVTGICRIVVSFIQQLGQPSQDPGIAQGCIDVIARLFPYYTHILLDEVAPLSAHVGIILHFTLQAIDCQDMMPKRSALDLWCKILKPPAQSISDSVRRNIEQIVNMYGPHFAQVLVYQIAGKCLRSELDFFNDVLKALITYPAAKRWLEDALFSSNMPQIHPQVGDVEKRRFVQQLMVTRGDGRKMKDVAKNFFAACRGTVVSY
nr:importin beta-like protein [Quercus suber]